MSNADHAGIANVIRSTDESIEEYLHDTDVKHEHHVPILVLVLDIELYRCRIASTFKHNTSR